MENMKNKVLIKDALNPPYQYILADQASLKLLATRLQNTINDLKKFGQHYPACAKVLARLRDEDATCSCGFDEAVKK